MKRKTLLKGIFSILLVFGILMFVGCPTDDSGGGGDALQGTWANTGYSVRFSGNNVLRATIQQAQTATSATYNAYGTYSLSGTTLTVTIPAVPPSTTSPTIELYTATITGGISLVISASSGGNLTGSYTKQ